MKNFNQLSILGIILIVLYGCSNVKEGFQNQKKNSSDEFLVEKKSPLVLPPEFNELPIPNENQINNKNLEENDIKNLIKGNIEDTTQETTNTDLEGSILSKIENR
ncbi:DUF3035 domain-containing protein [Candidatus Pelagibacter sp. HIMB1542]|uniref:DUF3035 domain-containing protein n=1 Tax=Candidatus Pelagibacter sp. HIMB1542 TaxID=3413346 RepID=UPI003F87D44E